MSFEDALHASLGLYMKAPEWLRLGAGRAYALLPSGWRHGRRFDAFAADAANHFHAAPWSLVEVRLNATLRSAATVPAFAAWSEVLLDERVPPFERLRQLPVVSKAQIKAAPMDYLNPSVAAARRLTMHTGGSTAEPMRFSLERGVSRPKESAYIRRIELRQLGASSEDWTLSLRGRTVAGAGRPGARLWTAEPIKRHLIFSSDHLEPRYMAGYVGELERLRPRLIHAFPSALYPLARWLRSHPCPAFSHRVVGILLTSESVYAYQLELLREVFPRSRIVLHYGHSERALMATATLPRGQYNFMPLYGLPELVDADGLPIDRPGVVGEIVGTGFDNAAMPFVRYRTGDLGVWAAAPGYGMDTARFAMQRIDGRLQEFVVCADHRLVSITTLGAAHFNELHAVDSIQFEQHSPGHLVLKVVARAPLQDMDRARIAAAVRDKTQGGCSVTVQAVERIERTSRGKQQMLVQHLDLSGYLAAAAHRADDDGALAGGAMRMRLRAPAPERLRA